VDALQVAVRFQAKRPLTAKTCQVTPDFVGLETAKACQVTPDFVGLETAKACQVTPDFVGLET